MHEALAQKFFNDSIAPTIDQARKMAWEDGDLKKRYDSGREALKKRR